MALSPARKRMNTERSSESPSDRFSYLPKHLIHQIMSLLPTRDSTRMSVLSTSFLDAWRSFPVIDFDCDSSLWSADSVLESLHRRRLDPNDVLERLSFRVDHGRYGPTLPGITEVITEMVSFATKNRAKELILDSRRSRSFGLPESLLSLGLIRTMRLSGFSSRKRKDFVLNCPLIEVFSLVECRSLRGTAFKLQSAGLKSVSFDNCNGLERIEIEGAAASLEFFSIRGRADKDKSIITRYEIINLRSCKSLKCLELAGIAIGDEWFEGVVSNLVALEVLKLRDCAALKNVRLRNEHLRRVDLQQCLQIENVDVVAQNLEFFQHSLLPARNSMRSGQCRISIGECKRLKELILRGVKGNFTDGYLSRNSRFRFLENLVLERCELFEEVSFRAERLKTLELHCCKNLRVAEIDAPNLVSFDYVGTAFPSPPLIVISGSPYAKLHLHSEYDYKSLRDFLSHFGHCKSLTLSRVCDKLIFPDELRSGLVSPMCDLKHLNLRLCRVKFTHRIVDWIENMLWLAPHLNTLSISSDVYKGYVVLKFYYSTTLKCSEGYGNNQPECCRSQIIKCWRHYLTRVEVKAFEGIKVEAKDDLQRFFMDNANAEVYS